MSTYNIRVRRNFPCRIHMGRILGQLAVAGILSFMIGYAAMLFILNIKPQEYGIGSGTEVSEEILKNEDTAPYGNMGQGVLKWAGAPADLHIVGMEGGENPYAFQKASFLKRNRNGTGTGTDNKKEKEPEDILIVLDPGHGGDDEGCSRENVLEKDINLRIALAVETRLKEKGFKVMLTRDRDRQVTLEERVETANNADADVYVSIHQNSCEEQSSKIRGIEVWYNGQKGEDGSNRLARMLHNNLMECTDAGEREIIEDSSLYVLRATHMPACLVETGFLSNREDRALLTDEEYQGRVADALTTAIELYFFPKTMYLTFDDGPSAENTEKVLDILKEHEIKATFFLIGENVEKHPEVARRIAEEGHTIGIHCYSHDYKKLYADTDSYLEDFNRAKEIVYEVTGVEVKLFRFPGGSINNYNKATYEDIIQAMTDKGYIYYDWNASLEDATKKNEPERLLKNARESTFGRKKVIMLAHDVISNTVLCLEELIEQFPEYRMLPLDEEVKPVQF